MEKCNIVIAGEGRMEDQADKNKNANRIFQVRILKEMREVKALLEVHPHSRDCGRLLKYCNAIRKARCTTSGA